MFVFPLGLQAKTKDFPWVTVSILVATSVYAILTFDAMHMFFSKVLNDPTAVVRIQKQKEFLLAACSKLKFSTAECGYMKREFHAERKETERQFALRLSDPSDEKSMNSERRREIMKLFVNPARVRLVAGNERVSKEYLEFEDALYVEQRVSAKEARDQNILTRTSYNFVTLFRSLFLHAGWLHLIGNMVFFLMFAIPLEQRVGRASMLIIYFVGGAAGMTLDLFMSNDSTRPLLGASASVAAVSAAFMVAFWSMSVRVYVTLFFAFNQIVLLPAWLFFAFFVVLHDLAGAFSVQGDGIAHVAHLGGFAVGALLGAIAVQLQLLPSPFAFPFELDLFVKSRSMRSLGGRLTLLEKILIYNRGNFTALGEAWNLLSRKPENSKTPPDLRWETQGEEAKRLLRRHFCDLLRLFSRNDDRRELAEFLKKVKEVEWPLAELVSADEIHQMMGLVRNLQSRGRRAEAVEVAKIMIAVFPNSEEAEALKFIERRYERYLRSKSGQRDGAGRAAS